MAVIINEFEIVPEVTPATPADGSGGNAMAGSGAGNGMAHALTPLMVEAALRHEQERQARRQAD